MVRKIEDNYFYRDYEHTLWYNIKPKTTNKNKAEEKNPRLFCF